ncbi:hypothetical protein PM082_007065 [Marasmius tenuissimus]|nr:hypothetical protein PM082_007065 [Marasmius tenuissimus]
MAEGVPRLTRAILSYPRQFLAVPLPYSQLTALHAQVRLGRPGSFDDFLQRLAECGNLQSLFLNIYSYPDSDSISSHTARSLVRLTALESLTVRYSRTKDILPQLSLFCSRITVPSLTHADLHFPQLSATSILDMISRSSAPLAKLTLKLHNMHTTPSVINSLFPFLHSVSGTLLQMQLDVVANWSTDLVEFSNNFADPLLGVLLSRLIEEETFLPKLGSIALRIEGITVDASVVDRVLEMLAQKQATAYPLLNFYLCRDMHRGFGTDPEPIEATLEAGISERVSELKRKYGVSVVIEERKA